MSLKKETISQERVQIFQGAKRNEERKQDHFIWTKIIWTLKKECVKLEKARSKNNESEGKKKLQMCTWDQFGEFSYEKEEHVNVSLKTSTSSSVQLYDAIDDDDEAVVFSFLYLEIIILTLSGYLVKFRAMVVKQKDLKILWQFIRI